MSSGFRNLVVLVPLALLLCGCLADPSAHFERAQQLAYAHLPKEALSEYIEVVSLLANKEGERAKSLRVRALKSAGDLCFLELKDPVRAIEHYRALLNRHPDHPLTVDVRANLADIYRTRLHDRRAAIAEMAAIIQTFPRHPEAHRFQYLSARDYFELHDWEQVRVEAQTLAERYPESEFVDDAQMLAAASFAQEGRREQAIAAFAEVVRRWPDSELVPRALYEQAHLYATADDQLDLAVEILVGALASHPSPQLVQSEIARLRKRIAKLRRPASQAAAAVWGQSAPAPAPASPTPAAAPAPTRPATRPPAAPPASPAAPADPPAAPAAPPSGAQAAEDEADAS